jgi:hypothetical protein
MTKALFTYPLLVLLVVSVVLFAKHILVNKRRRQWPGLGMAILAVPLFALYYNDTAPFHEYPLRAVVKPLAALAHGNADFMSRPVPMAMIGGLYAVRVVVYLRLAVRSRRNEINERLRRVNDRVGNFFAFTTVAILLGGMVVSMFALGWVGSVSVGAGFALLYMGVIGIFADALSLTAATSALGSVVLQRTLLWIATTITRPAVWAAGLYRAFRFNLRNLIRRIRAEEEHQRQALQGDHERGDDKLTRAEGKRERQAVTKQQRGGGDGG